MANFEISYHNSMVNEGGWTDKPHETAFGIDRYWNPNFQGWSIVDTYKKQIGPMGTSRKEWVRKLNTLLRTDVLFQSMVKKFYFTNFWCPNYTLINDQHVANFIFDRAINMGSKPLHKYVQRVLGFTGNAVDGIFGKNTLYRTNQRNPEELVKEMDEYVDENHYRRLAAKHPEDKQYLDSWLNRQA